MPISCAPSCDQTCRLRRKFFQTPAPAERHPKPPSRPVRQDRCAIILSKYNPQLAVALKAPPNVADGNCRRLDANPLDNVAKAHRTYKVYLRGREVDRAGLLAKWQRQWRER